MLKNYNSQNSLGPRKDFWKGDPPPQAALLFLTLGSWHNRHGRSGRELGKVSRSCHHPPTTTVSGLPLPGFWKSLQLFILTASTPAQFQRRGPECLAEGRMGVGRRERPVQAPTEDLGNSSRQEVHGGLISSSDPQALTQISGAWGWR